MNGTSSGNSNERLVDSADDRGLELHVHFKWDMNLDPTQESRPLAHFYLSSNYSAHVHMVELDTASGSMSKKMKFYGSVLETASTVNLLQGCNLNIDLYVRTFNAYQEPITNPAGGVIVPLYEIVAGLSPNSREPWVEKPIELYMVHDEAQKYSKGKLTLSQAGFGKNQTLIKFPPISLRGKIITPADVRQISIKAIEERVEKNQHICTRYIESTEVLYENVQPTIDTVANINSAIWVSRAGVYPPLFYTVDVVQPQISEAFYENCLDIVLRRLKLSREDLLHLDLSGNNRADVELMGSLAGQLLCCYIVHCSYRTDYAIVYSEESDEYIKVLTENFGDVSVDLGAGDCEDFGKMILRIYLGLMRYHKKTTDPALQHVIDFLKCYYPFLVLLGVSSAQINASPKDIVTMGAHENAMLTPLKQFMDELTRFNGLAKRWQEEMLTKSPEARVFFERSAKYPDLVLEGTGILEPTMKKEPSMRARIVLESFMEDEDIFFALRRSYYYDQTNTSFYKTVEKIFCPVPLTEGASFGSFLIMYRDRSVPDRVAIRKKLTKSANFSEFISDSKDVYIVMEPEFTAAEKLAAFEGMKDIHPPVPLDVPNNSPGSKQNQCDQIADKLRRYLRSVVSQPSAGPESTVEQVYYWRSGKVNEKTLAQLKRFFSGLPTRMLRGFEVDSEWVTDDVGGYRILLHLDRKQVDQVWSRNEAQFRRKMSHK